MNITAAQNIPRIQMILQKVKSESRKPVMSQSPQIRKESKIGIGFYEDFEHVPSLVNYDAIVLIDGDGFRPSYPVQKM